MAVFSVGGHLHGSVQCWGAPTWECSVFSFTERDLGGASTWQCSVLGVTYMAVFSVQLH